MTVKECYQFVENRLNKLGTNANDNIEKFQFVEAFNTAQYLWAEARCKLNETNIIRVDEVQQLLKPFSGKPKKTGSNYYELDLPSDYFHYNRSVSYVPCEIKNHLKKEANINRLLQDEFWKPSVEWGETICTIGNNKLRVYVDNFSISKIDLQYYRTPIKINMKDGYNDVNNEMTEDIDPEFQNVSLIEILNLTCQILAADNSDQWNYQTLSNLVQSNT